nr:hypothetical protein GOBAR_DD19008 [Tanacetum cinerariifolium]
MLMVTILIMILAGYVVMVHQSCLDVEVIGIVQIVPANIVKQLVVKLKSQYLRAAFVRRNIMNHTGQNQMSSQLKKAMWTISTTTLQGFSVVWPFSEDGFLVISESDGTPNEIWAPDNPRGFETLPPGLVECESDLYLQRLWGTPNELVDEICCRWYAKHFLHPDIVAPFDYIFIWGEDLGLDDEMQK